MHKYKLQLYVCVDGVGRAFYCYTRKYNSSPTSPDYWWSAVIVALIKPASASFNVKGLQSVLHQYSIDRVP